MKKEVKKEVLLELKWLAALDEQHRKVRYSDFRPHAPPRTEPVPA